MWLALGLGLGASFTASAIPLSPPILNPNNGFTYVLLDTDTWPNSEAEAVSLGGHLATVRNAVENQWLLDTFGSFFGPSIHLWIGLNDIAVEETFEWVSGEPVAYLNWSTGEPTGDGDFVALLRPGIPQAGEWNDANVPFGGPAGTPGAPVHGVVEIVPEPGSALLLALGAVGVAIARRRGSP